MQLHFLAKNCYDITDERIVEIHSEISTILGYVVSKPVLLDYALKIYNALVV